MFKSKKCKRCGDMFTPHRNIQTYCSIKCEVEQARKRKLKKEENKQKNINPFSEKRNKQLKLYRQVRDVYMKEKTICEVNECARKSEDLHHKNGRIGEMLYNTAYFMAVCRSCHQKIHNNPSWARNNNYLI